MKKENELIPKIIHYCWFGGKEKPHKVKKYISDWRRLLPDYEILEWNETNFPVDYCEYTNEAYKRKKYAFVSDVARLFALKNYGGFYFDTDIELRKNLDNYTNQDEMIMAFESDNIIMTGFIASKKNHKFVNEWLQTYEYMKFVLPDGSLDETANSFRVTQMLVKKNLALNSKEQLLENGIHIYERQIFGAYDVDNSCFVNNKDTVLIHHCNASWTSKSYIIKDKAKRILSKVLGRENYKRLREWKKQ